MDNELNVRGIVRPEISIQGHVIPAISLRGGIQKGTGVGGGVVMKTKAEWAELPTMMSKKGVFYVYTDYRQEEDPVTHNVIDIPRMKIGDGMTYVIDLPFETMSITDADIERWNNKSDLQVRVDEETNSLIFYINE